MLSDINNSIILQWINETPSSSGAHTTTLPIAYSENYACSREINLYSSSDSARSIRSACVLKNSLSSIKWWGSSGDPCMFVLIGY